VLFEYALVEFNYAIELNPEYVDAYYGRSMVYEEIGTREQVIADLARVIELAPNEVQAYYYRGLNYERLGDTTQEHADFEKVLELSDDPDIRQQALNGLRGYPIFGIPNREAPSDEAWDERNR
jgi:tetratricopeptide (TPR) repeat protein